MIIIQNLTDQEIQEKEILSWSIWEKEISKFNWEYDMDEYCYILEGEVIIETQVKKYYITKGDFVKFTKGLKCVWDIKKPIKKHYQFN